MAGITGMPGKAGYTEMAGDDREVGGRVIAGSTGKDRWLHVFQERQGWQES